MKSERTAFARLPKTSAPGVAAWKTDAHEATYAPALDQHWIADLDERIKPV